MGVEGNGSIDSERVDAWNGKITNFHMIWQEKNQSKRELKITARVKIMPEVVPRGDAQVVVYYGSSICRGDRCV